MINFRKPILKRILIIVLTAVLIAGAAARPGYAEIPGKYETLTDVLGITRSDIVQWLTLHEDDDYYLGTPYFYRTGDIYNGRAVQLNFDCLGSHWGLWPFGVAMYPYNYSPNGDVTEGGIPLMNCGGFVHHVLTHASNKDGSENLTVKRRIFSLEQMCDFTGMGFVGACSFYLAMYGAGVKAYRYSSIEETLASGILEKGDIIILDGIGIYGSTYDIYGNLRDWHIGIFWGDSPDDDVFWHSLHETLGTKEIRLMDGTVLSNPSATNETIKGPLNDPMDKEESVLYGNMISRIICPSQCEGVLVFKFGDLEPGWHEKTDGSTVYVDQDGCTANGWQIIDNTLYYFEDTVMCTDWKQINGVWYLFDTDGRFLHRDPYEGNDRHVDFSGAAGVSSFTQQTSWIERFRTFFRQIRQNILRKL